LLGNLGGEDTSLFKSFWSVKVVSKAQIIGWRVLLDKLSTKQKLARKGV